MSYTIKDKVAFVTGANRGIGKAIVESFINHGATKVYLAVRNPDSTRDLKAQYGDKVATIQADVTDAASIQQAAESAKDVDIVVNNAGVLIPALAIGEDAADALKTELDVNVYGLLRIANAFANTLSQKKGALVQLNSIASIKNFTPFTTYSASKAASYSITQGLRDQFKEQGVTVLSVHPGPIQTDMADSAGFEGSPPPSVVSEGIVSALATGDFHLFPDEMAKQFEAAYQGFADGIINNDFSE